MIDIRTTCKRYSIEDEFIKKIISILGIKYLMAPAVQPDTRDPDRAAGFSRTADYSKCLCP